MGQGLRLSPVEVVVIAAMEEEILPFLQRATQVSKKVQIGNSVHCTGFINDRKVLFVRGGIGLVNAAGAATSALLQANMNDKDALPPLVISAGSAGGLGESVRVGDVVVGTDNINADADARAFGYELGQVPGMPASYPVPHFLVDASDVGSTGHRIVSTVHHGLIVSSYAFVGQERAGVIKGQFDEVLATDMESSAIAQTCHAFKAPFLAVRGVSDLCGPASGADFLDHVDDAAERSAEIALAIIASWFEAGSPRPEFEPVFS